jgi:hypothetical protein
MAAVERPKKRGIVVKGCVCERKVRLNESEHTRDSEQRKLGTKNCGDGRRRKRPAASCEYHANVGASSTFLMSRHCPRILDDYLCPQRSRHTDLSVCARTFSLVQSRCANVCRADHKNDGSSHEAELHRGDLQLQTDPAWRTTGIHIDTQRGGTVPCSTSTLLPDAATNIVSISHQEFN